MESSEILAIVAIILAAIAIAGNPYWRRRR